MTLRQSCIIMSRLSRRLLHTQCATTSEVCAWKQRIDEYKVSEEDVRIIKGRRPFVKADVIRVGGPINGCMQIRWDENPSRDCDIQMNAENNFYSKHVRGLFYALVLALSENSKYVVLYIGNEVVQKVAMGINRAGKEAKLLAAIQKVTLVPDEQSEFVCKARVVYDPNVTSLTKKLNSSTTQVPIYNEFVFRERYSKDVDWLAH